MTHSASPAQAPAAPVRVLIIDDEPLVATGIQRLLRRGHDVEVRHSAQAALALFAEGARFDLILCDLTMPRMGGLALRAELARTFPAEVDRLFFLTGGADAETARELQRLRAVVLEKPVDGDALRAFVHQQRRARTP